jgi:hypothetical protein
MRRALRALAAQAVKGAAWDRRGNPLRRASPGCAGFMNLITLSATPLANGLTLADSPVQK